MLIKKELIVPVCDDDIYVTGEKSLEAVVGTCEDYVDVCFIKADGKEDIFMDKKFVENLIKALQEKIK